MCKTISNLKRIYACSYFNTAGNFYLVFQPEDIVIYKIFFQDKAFFPTTNDYTSLSAEKPITYHNKSFENSKKNRYLV